MKSILILVILCVASALFAQTVISLKEQAVRLAATQHSVTLNWTDSDSGLSKFNIYRGTTSGGPYSLVGSTANGTTLTYTDATVVPGTTYFYVVTAATTTAESANSNQASAAVPNNPNPPTGVTAVAN